MSTLTTPSGFSSSSLVFNESFSGTSLNSTYWNPYMTSNSSAPYPWNNLGSGYGSGMGAQYNAEYDEPSQVSVNNGLTLTAVQQSVVGGDYENGAVVPYTFPVTSGAVTSYGKMEFDGGYLQISMKQPAGDGEWSSLWLLPGKGAVGAGNNFEIDIQEGGTQYGSLNANSTFTYHLHTPSGTFGGAVDTGVDLTAGFHTYAINWVPGQSITWYLDGKEVAEITSAQAPIPNEPMELIMSNQVANSNASGWHTVLDSSTPQSMAMQVAGVQLYQAPGSGDTVTGANVSASQSTAPTVTAKPTVAITSVGGTVTQAAQTISGTVDVADAGSTVKLLDGATQIGTATVGSDGAWSANVTLANQGSNVITATDTNAAGTGTSNAVTYTLNPPASTPPAAPAISSFTTDSGVVGDHITNDNTPTLTGTAVANSTVKVFDGSTQVGTATANGSGQWTLTTSTLGDGAHSLTATDTDASGHTSAASTALAITIDTHAPAAPVETADSIVNTNHVLLSGTAEANSTITVHDGTSVVGTGTTNASGSWSVTTSALSSGTHALTATATDVAGNVSAASGALDPVIAATSTSSSSTTTGSSSTTGGSSTTTGHVQFTGLWESGGVATVNGTADPNSHVNLYEGNTQIGSATASSTGAWSIKTGTLSDTVHTFTAQEVDSTGHVVAKTSGEAIIGSSGRNVLTSTSGDDVFFGNGHPDTFVFAANFGHDVIKDFHATGWGHDAVQFSSSEFANFSSVMSHASQVGADTIISAGSDTLTLKNVKMSTLTAHDFHFA